jgi:hypothetical protein
MPVTNDVARVTDAVWNAVSSTPDAATPANRRRSSMRGRPWSRTAAIAVCQPIPNSRATAATECPSSPTRRQIYTTNPCMPIIAAAAAPRSRSTWGLPTPCPEHHGS